MEQLGTAPGAPGDVWLGTDGGTYLTVDDGRSWQPAAGGAGWRVSAAVAFSTQQNGLAVSRDGGRTWSDVALPVPNPYVNSVAFATPQDGLAVVACPRGLRRARLPGGGADNGRRPDMGGGQPRAVGLYP